jgi:putative heme iron utilization protein
VSEQPSRFRDHAVPQGARAATERTLDATIGLVGEPSDAERSRTLFTEARTATLSTIGVDPAGVPFGSLVAHAVDDAGRPILCLSDLAEHTRNLAADRRASVLVVETGEGDPLALGRATVMGGMVVLEGEERAAALQRYRAAHPGAFYADFADFRIHRLEVAAVRYVGGFGRMSWVDATRYAHAEPDPLRPHRAGIVDHMNDDHADSLLAFCRVLGDRPDTVAARMVDVDRYGFSVLASDGPESGEKALRFVFDEPADTPLAVRTAMVELVRRTRS